MQLPRNQDTSSAHCFSIIHLARCLLPVLACLLAVSGCAGFAVKPIPDRLPDESQARVDAAWEHMISLDSELDRQSLLDAVLLHQLWHVGVDHVEFSAQKWVGDVLVVMESSFDLDNPEGDVFAVSYWSSDGRPLREEEYTREELEEVIDLFMGDYASQGGINRPAAPGAQHRTAIRDARLERVEQIFSLEDEQ